MDRRRVASRVKDGTRDVERGSNRYQSIADTIVQWIERRYVLTFGKQASICLLPYDGKKFRMDPDFFIKAPAALHGFVRDAQRDLSAIRDRVVFLQPGRDVVTGIRALSTPGHTPSPLSFEVSGSDGLIITADAATSEVVAFEHPEWKFGYEIDPDLAIRSRKRLLDKVTRDRCRLLAFIGDIPGSATARPSGTAIALSPHDVENWKKHGSGWNF